jgi:hypothetical protein
MSVRSWLRTTKPTFLGSGIPTPIEKTCRSIE